MASNQVNERNNLSDDNGILKETGVEIQPGVKEPSPSSIGVDEVATLPKGTLDPVYEAKARVLNHAVSRAASGNISKSI